MSELTAYLDLPPNPDAPSAARRAVKSILRAWGLKDAAWLATAALIVSELVTNAVQHGRGTIGLHLKQVGRRVTVWAVDASATTPRRREPDESGGRGLKIVEALSSEWGVTNHKNGKRVWAKLWPYPSNHRPNAAAQVTP